MDKNKLKGTELIWRGKYDEEGNIKSLEMLESYPLQLMELIDTPRIVSGSGGSKSLTEFCDVINNSELKVEWRNKLIWGDNKLVLASLLENFAGKINLIYIDPPFATGSQFKYKIPIGDEREQIIKEHSIMEDLAYRDAWGKGLDSYLQMMHERLILMKDLLAEDGSIIVHLDKHISHYIKLLLDEIFGIDHFINEIIWCYGGGGAPRNYYPQKHDVLFWYSKGKTWTFNKQFRPYTEGTIQRGLTQVKGDKYVLDEKGAGLDDWWAEKEVQKILSPTAYENLKFPTQKPEGLLKRIIFGHSNPNDLVADFFCGSGTTLAVAEKLDRRWIGCDLSKYAIHLTKKRLLEIEKTPDLVQENKSYRRNAKPFELLSFGKYERQYWYKNTFSQGNKEKLLQEYQKFILHLYGAEPIEGRTCIHGKKGNAFIFIGSIDCTVTVQEVRTAIEECKSLGGNELHILCWDWELGLRKLILEEKLSEAIKIKLRIIPYDILDRQKIESGTIKFFELPDFKINIQKEGNKGVLKLVDFIIPQTDLVPNEIKDKIKKWNDWVDYWAVDFNFKNNIFNNNFISFRTMRARTLNLRADYSYKNAGNYKICVKVFDIFGNEISECYVLDLKEIK
ncbi:MAG TPA: site-specific DNA-methyltransferase [Candidatus Deferrimicrobium sp.]|nr:site-specific DNA-methyltransferase [Candidatus Deferrimicrobium sp.]